MRTAAGRENDRVTTVDNRATSLAALTQVQDRVLWLAMSIIHHANRVRKTPSGVKVGGHQASSASMVSIMTALWFEHLRAADRVSVKPHASPVLHAIEYLLGELDGKYLTTLREFGGLQSYPSRLKDPIPADFSTGSVGIGATATIWSALSHRYVAGHFEVPRGGRHVALLGDAELDEGACWEAIVDPAVAHLGEVLWIVDLNRQSLDRIVPEIATERLESMFGAAGWQTITVKYGRWLHELFAREGGECAARADRLDGQRGVPAAAARRRRRAAGAAARQRPRLARADQADLRARRRELLRAIRDLGGHDLGELLEAFAAADSVSDRPSVVFAYTIKAWRLATQGHPGNHSALLNDQQWEQLAGELGADPSDPWATFAPGTPESRALPGDSRAAATGPRYAAPIRRRCRRSSIGSTPAGRRLSRRSDGFFVDLAHGAPEVAARVVTVSPDVASSTNLGGWINRLGIWHLGERIDWFADDTDTLVRWRESEHGQHIELGIAEGNLVGMLGELGVTFSRDGEPLLPIGTLYDPFVNRALEPWSFGMYAGAQSILIGTPSGVTLAPEGGAHQSIITPSVGLEQPSASPGSQRSDRTWSGRCYSRCRGWAGPTGPRRTSG